MTEKRPRSAASALEWRLYILAGLASVHLLVWLAITDPAPATAPPRAEPPAAARPTLVVPAGWRLATEPPPPAEPAVVKRTPPRPQKVRRRRVRTRSS